MSDTLDMFGHRKVCRGTHYMLHCCNSLQRGGALVAPPGKTSYGGQRSLVSNRAKRETWQNMAEHGETTFESANCRGRDLRLLLTNLSSVVKMSRKQKCLIFVEQFGLGGSKMELLNCWSWK